MGAASALFAQNPSSSRCIEFDKAYFSWVGRLPLTGVVFSGTSAVIRLDTAHHERRLPDWPPADARSVTVPAMRVDSASTRRWQETSFWRLIRPDTLDIRWHNGLYGPVLRLAIRGDSVLGHVRFLTDIVGAEQPLKPAAGRFVPCPG